MVDGGGEGKLARIGKQEHARILRMVDGERRKVAEVAAEYGCTAANIYALLGKLRRAAPPAAEAISPGDEPVATPALPAAPPPPTPAPAIVTGGRDLFAVVGRTNGETAAKLAAAPEQAVDAATATPARSVVTQLPAARRGERGGVGATMAKPGMALVMRTGDGDDNLTPFRSLDDLLSAIKPILRAAARSPDAVWFSIQPVDLATLDSDAA